MFVTRLLSGIVLVVMVTVMNVCGGAVMDLILLAVSIIGLNEFYRAVAVGTEKKKNCFEWIGIIGTVLYFAAGFASYLVNTDFGEAPRVSDSVVSMNDLMAVIVFVLLGMMGAYVFLFPKYEGGTVMKAFFGFVYVTVMLHFIFMTRVLYHGEYLVWLIFIVSWVCDTSAYCVGMLIGKHKLAPVLSPKKTIEGAVGGVAGSTIVSCLFAFLLLNKGFIDENLIWLFAIIGIVGAVASQIGDLAASAFKRNYNIKDYGNLIPGHGGIIDRLDSVIVSAPMIYFLAQLLGRLR